MPTLSLTHLDIKQYYEFIVRTDKHNLANVQSVVHQEVTTTVVKELSFYCVGL